MPRLLPSQHQAKPVVVFAEHQVMDAAVSLKGGHLIQALPADVQLRLGVGVHVNAVEDGVGRVLKEAGDDVRELFQHWTSPFSSGSNLRT